MSVTEPTARIYELRRVGVSSDICLERVVIYSNGDIEHWQRYVGEDPLWISQAEADAVIEDLRARADDERHYFCEY